MPTADTLRFSVVIPAYNEADFLERTLRSLRQQDFHGDWEVIVVDNGSTDATSSIAERYGARVINETQRGVCAARQRGTSEALGEIVVSTDADTVHPVDWLTTIDRRFRSAHRAGTPVVAVAGPCRYEAPLWWAGAFPPLYFWAIGIGSFVTGRPGYLTATNVAFRRDGFPGYDVALTQGGDEVDLLRRLQGVGRVAWDGSNTVLTSSRRMDQGLLHTLVVSYGYHYALSYLLNRASARTVIGPAPAIRAADNTQVNRRRRAGRVWALAGTVALLGLARGRSRRSARARSARHQSAA